MVKTIVINPEKCSSCRICELVCSAKHHYEYNPSRSRIKVDIFADEFVYIPHTCQQCNEPWCMNICPTGALARDEKTDAVKVESEKCVGCKMCILACPFGNMKYDSENGCAEKCDLCGGKPECVKHCFFGALEYQEPELISDTRHKLFSERLKASFTKEVE